jgi:hypothetical protein
VAQEDALEDALEQAQPLDWQEPLLLEAPVQAHQEVLPSHFHAQRCSVEEEAYAQQVILETQASLAQPLEQEE